MKGLKKSKKTLLLFLSIVMVLSIVLSACANENGNNNDDVGNNSSSNSKKGSTADDKAGKTGNDEPEREKLTLNWFLPAAANANLPDEGDFVKEAIEEKFNVEMDVDYMPTSNDYNTKINTLLASDPPDMWRNNTGDGGKKYVIDGLLADLSELVTPETMPNYFELVSEKTVEQYTAGDAGYFRAPLPFAKERYRSYYIRQDWLENLDLDIPQSYEEYIEIMKAFRNDDPDGNGEKDTYAYSTGGGGNNITMHWPEFPKYGLPIFGTTHEGKFVDAGTDPRVEFVINDLAKVMEMDVVDPDWFLQKGDQAIEKAIQGKVGILVNNGRDFALDNNTLGVQYRTKQLNPDANWMPFNPIPEKPLASAPRPGHPFLFAKQVADESPENIERSIEILDWLASEEGYLLTNYGVEGEHYTREGNEIRVDPEAYTSGITDNGDFLNIWNFFTVYVLPEQYGLKVIDPNETDRDREVLETILSYPVDPGPGIPLSQPEGFDIGAYRTKMRELQAQALFEDKSGENWPEYREILMTEYNGQVLLDHYTSLVKKAGVVE